MNDHQQHSFLNQKAQQGVDSYLENNSAVNTGAVHHRKRSFVQSNSSTRSSSKGNKPSFKTLANGAPNKQLSYSPIMTTQK